MIRLERILVPVDFSEYSEKAVRYGIELARGHGSKLYFVHVISQRVIHAVQELNVRGYKGDFVQAVRKLVQDKENDLRDFVPQSLYEGIETHFSIRKGSPAEEVIEASKNLSIDLIVLGSKGHSALASVLIGSVVQKVVNNAPCPVLVVRPLAYESAG